MTRSSVTIALLLALLLVKPASGQEQDEQDAETEPATEASEQVADNEEPEIDDSDLDQQTYEEDDDDFVPTEEIPAGEPIPFPSNI